MNLDEKTPALFKPQGHNILIVDDTPVNLGVVVDFLQSYGFGIRIARSGESALKRVQYDPPDVILLDVLMPGLDGFEICRRLKENEATTDIPVIFMTSLTNVEDKVKGFELGAVDYVTKPLHQEEVLARITTHLRLRDLTRTLADQKRQLEISSRIEQARLFEAVSQQREQLQILTARLNEVQEAERKALARELHDELGQALTGININLVAIKNLLPESCFQQIEERVVEAQTLTEQTLKQMREMSLNLRPPMLDDLGVVSTLRWYIKRYAQRVDIKTEFQAIGFKERLAPDVETTLYRVAQEALTNVARHAQAGKVRLRLERAENKVWASIEDDGRGFEVQDVIAHKLPAQGAGLFGIRERVTALGGTFDIQSQPGQGTRLSIEIPV